MHRRNINANYNMSQMAIDILVLIISYFVAGITAFISVNEYLLFPSVWVLIVFGLTMFLTMFSLRMYDITTFLYTDRIIYSTVVSVLVATLAVCSVMFFTRPEETSWFYVFLYSTYSFIFLVLARSANKYVRINRIGKNSTNVLFVGNDECYAQYIHFLQRTAMKVKICGKIQYSDPAVTSEKAFEKILKDRLIDEVVMVQEVNQQRHAKVQPLLAVCEEMGVTASLMLNIYKLPTSNYFVSSVGTFPMITYHNISFDKVQLFFKRVLDIILSFIGLVLSSPILLATAIAIKLESPGNVIFKQVRIGKNSKPFKIYKFRSMYIDAEERKKELMAQNQLDTDLMFKMENDPRITKVGKFIRKTSIDELPQLLNILIGDMSLVGTRPPTKDEVEKYERHHLRRISITPGLTGMWQVSGRSSITDFEQVVELDRTYIENWSLLLDVKLVFKTVLVVLKGRGAS